jgi:predicted outer membrane protein
MSNALQRERQGSKMWRQRISLVLSIALTLTGPNAATLGGAIVAAARMQHSPGVGSAARVFVEEMSDASLGAIKLGEMAAGKATNQEIREFARSIIVDHSRTLSELAQPAAALGVRLPVELDPTYRAIGARLYQLDGTDFDREYIYVMIEHHGTMAGRLRARIGNRRNSTQGADEGRDMVIGTSGRAAEHPLALWASRTLPNVERHLERLRRLQKRVG